MRTEDTGIELKEEGILIWISSGFNVGDFVRMVI